MDTKGHRNNPEFVHDAVLMDPHHVFYLAWRGVDAVRVQVIPAHRWRIAPLSCLCMLVPNTLWTGLVNHAVLGQGKQLARSTPQVAAAGEGKETALVAVLRAGDEKKAMVKGIEAEGGTHAPACTEGTRMGEVQASAACGSTPTPPCQSG